MAERKDKEIEIEVEEKIEIKVDQNSENKDEEKKIATLLSFLSTLRNYYIMMRGEI